MIVITNRSTLKKLGKMFGFKFDRVHGYIIDSGNLESCMQAHKKMLDYGYDLKYISGCFYPYIIEKNS